MIHLDTNSPGLDSNPAYNLNASELPCSEDPLSYDIMRYPVTVGRSVRHPESITVRDIGYVMDCMRKGDFEGYDLKRAIHNLRQMKDKQAQKNAKLTLPWFSGSLIRKSRSNLNVEKAQFQIFDIDHVDNPEQLKELAVSNLPYICFAFCSAVDGVKLIAGFTQAITKEDVYKRIYGFLALQIEWTVKHICDCTSDWSRACYMTHDSNLLSNLNCKPLDPLVTYKQAVSVMEIPWPSRSHLHPIPITEPSPNYSGAKDSCEHPHDPTHESLLPNKIETNSKQTTAAMTPVHRGDTSTGGDDYHKAAVVINIMSKIPIVYKDWIKMGQALRAGFGEQGKALWDMFLNNPNYNDSQRTLDAHWRSFHSVKSIRLASLFYVAEQYGVKYE